MHLNRQEKETFLLLLMSAFCIGFINSAFQIQDVIAKKALNALDWQVTLLVMLWPLSNLFSIWWGRVLEHSHNLSGFFLLLGYLGRLPLVLMMFVSSFYPFLALVILMFSFNALMSPALNTIYQTNFTHKNRGIAFGFMSSLIILISLIATYITGKLLDVNETYFRYFFVIAAIFGTIGAIIMARIRINKNKRSDKAFPNKKQLLLSPVKRSIEVLKKNKDFACFERNYFVYGIGFMVILPAIPKYLVDYLQMDYSQTFLAKGVLSQLGILLLAPLAGKLFSRINPMKFNAITFGLLSLYPLILLISSFFIGQVYTNYLVYLAFIVFGIAMAGVFISWNISSIYFAGNEDVAMYQGLHVTLTGIRGLFAPFLGYAILELLGMKAVFFTSMFMLMLSSYLNFLQFKTSQKKIT